MAITSADIAKLRSNAATHFTLSMKLADDESGRRVAREDKIDLEVIVELLEEGKLDNAAYSAGLLDTLVRDLIPQPIWIALMAEVA